LILNIVSENNITREGQAHVFNELNT